MTRRLPEHTKTKPRALRREVTDAESVVWYNLRRHGLAGLKFRRQHPFGPYILDFYCAEARVVIELDGGQHFEDGNLRRDAERTNYIEAHGLRVLRFTNTEALTETDSVLGVILEALTPLPRGARGAST